MRNIFKICAVVGMFVALVSSSYAITGSTPQGHIYQLTKSTQITSNEAQPTHPFIVPLVGVVQVPPSKVPMKAYYLEVNSAQTNSNDNHSTAFDSKHLMWGIFSRATGSIAPHYNLLPSQSYGVGVQPSVISTGTNGYFIEVNSTQGAQAIQAYLMHVTDQKSQIKLQIISNINIGRGSDPSISSIGDDYYLVVCNSTNNTLAAYIFKATNISISEPNIIKTYANGNTPAIVSLGNGKFLETNNSYFSGVDYYLLSASKDNITESPLVPSGSIARGGIINPYSNVQLLPVNITGTSSDTKSILDSYSMPSPENGLWSRVLSYKNNILSVEAPYKYARSGSDATIAPFLNGGGILEINTNMIGSSSGISLFGSLLY